jgi:hypothetical protein
MMQMKLTNNAAPHEPRRPRRGFRGGQLLGILPTAHAPTFFMAFQEVGTGFEVTFLSLNGDTEMWVKPALLPEQWAKWDELYEKVCKELSL